MMVILKKSIIKFYLSEVHAVYKWDGKYVIDVFKSDNYERIGF